MNAATIPLSMVCCIVERPVLRWVGFMNKVAPLFAITAPIALLLALTTSIHTPKAKNYDVEVDAITLHNDYWNDEKKADRKYKDKRIFLHGIVLGRSANLWSVFLKTNPSQAPSGIVAVIGGHLADVPDYKPGDRFDLICMGVGKIMGLPLSIECKLP
jgi:hypothetical protein